MSISKSYSLNTKITLSFVALGFLLLSILFIQIIPNMEEEQKRDKKNEIENMIELTNEQIKLAVQLLIYSREEKIEKIEIGLNNIIEKYDSKSLKVLKNIEVESKCKASFYKDRVDVFSKDIKDLLVGEGIKIYTQKQEHMCPKKIEKFYFLKTLKDKRKIILECKSNLFDKKYPDLEEGLKKDLQKSFSLTNQEHKGKINLIWINTNNIGYLNKPLYDKSDKFFNNKYCLSKMSSSLIPQTGELTGKELVEASNKEPVYHNLNNKASITWIRTVKDFDEVKLLFLTTIYEEDFKKNFSSPFLKVFPAAILSLVIALLLGFFLFKRLFKSINILTNTAKEINDGNLNLRSNIYGNDDIAVLAKAFDNMLDSIEENIKNLDKKVEEKTKELSTSLEEKEVLLKEIHHRVKNNLAMTINLIKLQKSKIDDDKTKEILVDIQERIFTMELLHRKLYESKDLSSIPFKKYVCELSEDLYLTYGKSRNININCQMDDISLSIEYALPCGLIITECLTNAYKYAFVKEHGTITISLTKKDSRLILVISDDGIGLPKNIDINKSKTLGLRLISSIVQGQLLGTFNYVYKNGSKFYINFKI